MSGIFNIVNIVINESIELCQFIEIQILVNRPLTTDWDIKSTKSIWWSRSMRWCVSPYIYILYEYGDVGHVGKMSHKVLSVLSFTKVCHSLQIFMCDSCPVEMSNNSAHKGGTILLFFQWIFSWQNCCYHKKI